MTATNRPAIAKPKRRIRILATGGTIAGLSGAGRGYQAGKLSIDQLLAKAGALVQPEGIEVREVARIGSQDIHWEHWTALHRECCDALADPAVSGVVITHGTDTAEETGLLLDLTLSAGKPVTIVGAMRPVDALGSDGMRNLANALRVAGDPAAGGRGVLLVMSDEVLAAWDARKSATQSSEAFTAFPCRALAAVTPAALTWFAPPDRIGRGARFPFPEALPKVEIVYAHAGLQVSTVEALRATGAAGFVLAGMGQGNAPAAVLGALARAVHDGVPVVRASRVCRGLVERNVEVDDDACGFVAAGGLNPAKSRIMLQLLIASGVTEPKVMQAAFDGSW